MKELKLTPLEPLGSRHLVVRFNDCFVVVFLKNLISTRAIMTIKLFKAAPLY